MSDSSQRDEDGERTDAKTPGTDASAEPARKVAGRRADNERRRERHESRLRDLARRFVERERGPREPDDEGERDGYVPLEVAREAVSALLETGDRAKTEMVRMVAREVRNYLGELKLGEELRHLLRDHKLEVHATFALRPNRAEPEAGRPAAEPTEPPAPPLPAR